MHTKGFGIFIISTILMLGGCSDINDLMGMPSDANEIKDTSDRIDIMSDVAKAVTSEGALQGLALGQPQTVAWWPQENATASNTSLHIKGSLMQNVVADATIGDGNEWIQAALPSSPVVSAQDVFAMDGRGIITAHKKDNVEQRIWRSSALKSDADLLIGGLALSDNALKTPTLFAVNGNGTLAALSQETGAVLWKRNIGTSLRSSVRYFAGNLFLTTVDSQLLVYDAQTGTLNWKHRGIGETANLFGTSLPAVTQRTVTVSYQSGELFQLSRIDGRILWGDIMNRPRRTKAIGYFTGVDANPLLTSELVISSLSSGLLAADDIRNGMRVWEQPFGARHTPWSDNNLLYVVTEHNQLAAMSAQDGRIGWLRDLYDGEETAPRYFGPFVINNTIVTLDANGIIHQYTPQGAVIRSEVLTDSIAATPAFSDNYAYIIGSDATLYQVQ